MSHIKEISELTCREIVLVVLKIAGRKNRISTFSDSDVYCGFKEVVDRYEKDYPELKKLDFRLLSGGIPFSYELAKILEDLRDEGISLETGRGSQQIHIKKERTCEVKEGTLSLLENMADTFLSVFAGSSM